MTTIGFHVGPAGNPTGIGDYVRRLDAAAIPAFIMSADVTTGISDALTLIHAGSTVPHTLIFRVVKGGDERYAVPNYNLSPYDAAVAYWRLIEPEIPPEIKADRQQVWIQLVNEPDKSRADWLGYFGVDVATIANRAGYKVSLFGWASGEPEPQDWETPGLLAYLDYCGENNAAAISVHEYSYEMTLVNAFPHLIGRFTNILNTCAAYAIPYPTIHVTELGWTYNDLPDVAAAMDDLAWAYEVYRPYPQVSGLGVWYLGTGFGDIANKAQRLIAPVTDFMLNNPPTPPTSPVPPVNYKVVAHLAPQVLTRAEYDLMANEAVPLKQSVVFSADDAARLVAPGQPGSKVICWWPERWPDDIVSWLHGKGVAIVETRPLTPPIPPPTFTLKNPLQGIPLFVTDMFNAPRAYSPPYHEGLDLRATNSNGQAVKVLAAASGDVDGIRWVDPGTGYGLYVRTRHVMGDTTHYVWYAHLGSIAAALAVGQPVTVGQELGVAGSTGNSTGIHLHLTVQKVPGGLSGYIVANVIDPAPLLGLPPTTLPGPGTTPPPPQGNAGIGLHAPADPVFVLGDFTEFATLRPNWIKVLSSHSFADINRLAAAHPTASFVVRAFLSMWQNGQPRVISPAQFVTDTVSDVRRAVDAIAAAGHGQAVIVELHNEPNLYHEGLGGAWTNGATYSTWALDVLTRYRQQLPNLKYAFPGLSPGPTVPNVRLDHATFMNACLNAAAAHDYLGVHAYWNSTTAPISTALAVVDGYIAQVPTKPILITEASNNQSGNAEVMATDYVAFWQELRKRPRVQGVMYFVCNASNPEFAPELWTPRQLGAKVRAKMP